MFSKRARFTKALVVMATLLCGLVVSTGAASASPAAPTSVAYVLTPVASPKPDAVPGCGDHIQIGYGTFYNANEFQFRVTGNGLGSFLGAGGLGEVFATVFDDNGSEGYGPYGASADTGTNFSLTGTATEFSKGPQVSVSLTNYDNTSTLCSQTYSISLIFESLKKK